MKKLLPLLDRLCLVSKTLAFTICAFTLLNTTPLKAQSPIVCPINAGADQSVCTPNCATLIGTFVPTNQTTGYVTSTVPYAPDPFNVGTAIALWDDQWSPVIALPFTFCFYGTAYNQILIGSNGLISFSLVGAGGYCQWPIGAAVPSTADPMNTIMGPWVDINPGVGGQIRYSTYGAAPCRRFVVSWYQVPMYSCGTPITQQITLYERTNIIDNFIQTKPACAWNGNYAIQAVHNATGTAAVAVAGRNWPTGWTANNDAKRWTPNGASTVSVGWYVGATLVGAGATYLACPLTTTTYTFQATYTNCNSTTVTVSDQVIVNVSSLVLSQSQVNNTCAPGCIGSATVNVTSGTGPFTYAWAPSGGTGTTATGLCAGTYTCTVTGAGGCTGQATFAITAPPAITLTPTQTNVLCNAVCNGSASVVATGGTGVYTYAWSPSGGTFATATGLCAGTYTCTVTSGPVGCTQTQTFNIAQPTAITTTGSQINILCNGGNTGSANVTPSGGTGPYTYSWSPSGGTGSTATGLGLGVYTVTVTDANGCTATRTFSITQPTAIASTMAMTPATCSSSNGTASITPSGGTGPYSYNWTPGNPIGDGTANVTGLTSGVWTCVVTDANGCTHTNTINVTTTIALSVSSASTPALCFGGNGSATVTILTGTGPYTYAWTPSGGTGSTATVPVGSYTCLVTDLSSGCTATTTVSITQPTALAAVPSQTNILCNSSTTGSAAVVASGGTGPYTYAWSPSGGIAATAIGLGAGTYTATITDANGCTLTQTFTITQPTAVSATTAFTQGTCSISNGSASVVASGGVGPYTYSWSPSGGTGSTATGLAAGAYTCLITDANGCTFSAAVAVPNAASPTATITATTNVSCFGGNNGSSTVTGLGGTGPYTYAWTPTGGTGTIGSPLIAGNYTVTVTDANGCSTTATTVVTQPPLLTATAASSPVLCNGGTTGIATVTPTGGAGSYTYNWTPSGGTGATTTGLAAGTYTATVTDANGCTITATTTITQPTALTAVATASPVLCFGGTTGSTSVTLTGGTGAYTYSWSPSGGTSASATGLIAGVYVVTATDANGCTITATATVTEPTALAATTSFTQTTCGSANGSAAVAVTGGTTTYTYLWSPSGATAATASNLLSGVYSCLITDLNGCTLTATVNVPSANSPTVTIGVPTMLSCFGGNNGSATASSTGGTTPYTYFWSNADADSIAGNLIAGTYTVTVTDANGCSDTSAVTITEPTLLTSAATSTDVLCFGGSTGTAAVTETGGVGPYTYSWSPSGGTSNSEPALIAGAYTVTVTDANNCTTTATTTVNEPPALTFTATFTPVSCFAGTDGTTTATAGGGLGAYSYAWSPSGGTAATEINLAAGVYSCIVTDGNGCSASATTTVTEPSAITSTSSFTQATCNASNGSATVVPSGGSGAFTYAWSPSGGTTATASNIAAGAYTCLITDANGCTLTVSVTVQNANAPTVTIGVPTMVSCFAGTNGSATASSTGGTGPFSYLWSNADADSIAGNIGAGTYTVTVTDVNGCTSSATVLITEPSLLNVQASATPATVCEGSPVTLSANAGGGTPTYTYGWLPGPLVGATQNITPTATTTYVVTVSDANGCTVSAPVVVTVNAMPVAILSANNTSGCAPLCVNFTDASTLTSGTITSWSWDFGDQTTSTQQNPSHCYTTAGSHDVILTVTTASGCTQTITMANYITVYSVPVAAFGAGPLPTTILNPNITFTDLSFNANSWLWSFGDLTNSSSTDQNPTFTYPDPTCYMVILEVTSFDGCIDTASQEVCIDPDVSIYVPNTFTPDENGTNELFIPVTVGINPEKFEMWIFDRWGNVIFYTDDINEGWDGRVIGSSEICQQDTYVWKISVKDMLDKKHELLGHVNLIK